MLPTIQNVLAPTKQFDIDSLSPFVSNQLIGASPVLIVEVSRIWEPALFPVRAVRLFETFLIGKWSHKPQIRVAHSAHDRLL